MGTRRWKMRDLYFVLRMNLDPSAPEGAGWYVYASAQDEGAAAEHLISAVRVAPQAATIVAGAFEHVLQGSLPPGGTTPTQLVGSGNNLIRNEVKRQLEEAEEYARRVKTLRQSLQALEAPEASDKVVKDTERQE